jgi:hypothetical protein
VKRQIVRCAGRVMLSAPTIPRGIPGFPDRRSDAARGQTVSNRVKPLSLNLSFQFVEIRAIRVQVSPFGFRGLGFRI